jgi:hypothetical protein
MPTATFVASALFAAIFIFGWHLHRAHPSRAVISMGAGMTAAYVFVHMLPELRVYAAALLGFVVFYGLENLVRWKREGAARGALGGGVAGVGAEGLSPVFLLHVGGFALYAWLVCYLMVRGISEKPLPIALFALAMGLHFYGVDHSLFREHGAVYLRVGRFVLAAAALAGWAVAMMTEVPRPSLITGLGLISGGVVMNSMVMELPREKEGRFWPFVFGALVYTLLLALVR